MRILTLTSILAVLLLPAFCYAGPQPPGFKLHAHFLGIGGCLKTIIAPGPTPGSQRLYASHIYPGNTLDVVAVDPLTGHSDVFSSPVKTECGAWAMVEGPDGQVYIGTLPSAHIMRVDWAQHRLVDLGRPAPSEQYIWQLAVGSDKKLYGCTYPHAKLVRFDPATGKGEDLGRMNATENYARSVAADDHGFVYVGIGTASRDLVAYEIATGQHRSILPPDCAGIGTVSVTRAVNGKVYADAGGKWLALNGWQAVPVPGDKHPPFPHLQLADGRAVSYSGRTITVHDAKGKTEVHQTDYQGKAQDIFRLALGPDGRLYASTALPIHFFWADPESQKWQEIAHAGGGEYYSFLAWENELIGAAYSAPSPITIYHPDRPWKPGKSQGDNPWQIHYSGENSGWRPMAMIAGPDHKVYLGAVSGYGRLGGPLCVLDPASGKVDQYLQLVKDESVVALAALPDGLIVGGTTIGGGGGSHPTQTEAKLFLWDPRTRQKVFETTPVPGQQVIGALAVGKNGLVYGLTGDKLFTFDPQARQVLAVVPQTFGGPIYNSLAPGPGGKLYGLTSHGLITINETTNHPELVAKYPPGITGGFAIRGREIYFIHGPDIVSYELPLPKGGPGK